MQANAFQEIKFKSGLSTTDNSGNELVIEKTKLAKVLGTTIGDDLKWTGHIDRMVGKANRILGMLKRTFVIKNLGL